MLHYHALHLLKTNRLLHSGLVLLCLAVLLGSHTLWHYHSYAQAPIVIPLRENHPLDVDMTFTSPMPNEAAYIVRIDLPHNVTGDHYTKALQPLDCYWSVTGSEPVLGLHDRQPDSGAHAIEAYNGFWALPGHRYTVHVDSKPMPTALRSLHPRLIVDISCITDEHLFFQKIMPLILFALFLGVLGGACLLSAITNLLLQYYWPRP